MNIPSCAAPLGAVLFASGNLFQVWPGRGAMMCLSANGVLTAETAQKMNGGSRMQKC